MAEKSLRYQSLRANDDHDEIDDLEAHLHDVEHLEDDESIDLGDLDDKDYMRSGPRSRWTRFVDAMIKYWWLIDGVLVLVIILLLVDRRLSSQCSSSSQTSATTQKYEGAGDVTGFAPQFSQRITTFQPDPGFLPENTSEFWSLETRQKWLDIVPQGLGYLKIENPEKYKDLPTKLEGYGPDYVVTTSMTHQLHCLYAITEAYAAYSSGKNGLVPTESEWHIRHCVDYIRQGIMCAGDVAVEGKETTFPEGVIGSDGWDARHVCKSNSEILSYLSKNAVNDERWI